MTRHKKLLPPLAGRRFLYHTPPMELPHLYVIVGPTASGKTGLAIELARHVGGEVISADSRQVYRGLDLGSAKVTEQEMKGVPHHCLDIASPRSTCTVHRWRLHAERAIRRIVRVGHVPIVAGGTGFYVDALMYGHEFPAVKPDHDLRRELSGRPPEALFAQLEALDPERAASIERKNPRRLIRAIEVARALGKVPPLRDPEAKSTRYEATWLGLAPPRDLLAVTIHERVLSRLRQGMLEEVKDLRNGTHQAALSWKRLLHFGLEYRYIALHLQGKLTHEEMIDELVRDTLRFARRQMTWFKRNPNIRWFPSPDEALTSVLDQAFH